MAVDQSTKYGLTSDSHLHPPFASAFQACSLCNDKKKKKKQLQRFSHHQGQAILQSRQVEMRALLTRDTHKAYAISTHEGPPPPSPWPYSNILAWTCPLSFSCLTVFKTWQKQEALFLNFVK